MHRASGFCCASWCLQVCCCWEKNQLRKGWYLFLLQINSSSTCVNDKQRRMCCLFGFEKEVMHMPEPCSYISPILSCKLIIFEHGQWWAGEVPGESRGALGACSPYLRPNLGKNWEGFGVAKAAALVSSLHRRRGGGWRSPGALRLLEAPQNTSPSQPYIRVLGRLTAINWTQSSECVHNVLAQDVPSGAKPAMLHHWRCKGEKLWPSN